MTQYSSVVEEQKTKLENEAKNNKIKMLEYRFENGKIVQEAIAYESGKVVINYTDKRKKQEVKFYGVD